MFRVFVRVWIDIVKPTHPSMLPHNIILWYIKFIFESSKISEIKAMEHLAKDKICLE